MPLPKTKFQFFWALIPPLVKNIKSNLLISSLDYGVNNLPAISQVVRKMLMFDLVQVFVQENQKWDRMASCKAFPEGPDKKAIIFLH